MEKTNLSRRQFVKGLAGTTIGIATFGSSMGSFAKSYSRIIGANERIKIGVIGCGGMANGHMEALLKMKESDNVEITAVCDVYTKRLDKAKELTKARAFKNYQEILENKDEKITYLLCIGSIADVLGFCFRLVCRYCCNRTGSVTWLARQLTSSIGLEFL